MNRQQWCKKLSKSQIGTKKDKKYCAKLSNILKEFYKTEKGLLARQKRSIKLKGRIITAETRLKLSIANKGMLKGRKLSKETIIKIKTFPSNHHINFDHNDNRENNQILITRSQHSKLNGDIFKLVKPLMEKNIICFDRNQLTYKLGDGK